MVFGKKRYTRSLLLVKSRDMEFSGTNSTWLYDMQSPGENSCTVLYYCTSSTKMIIKLYDNDLTLLLGNSYNRNKRHTSSHGFHGACPVSRAKREHYGETPASTRIRTLIFLTGFAVTRRTLGSKNPFQDNLNANLKSHYREKPGSMFLLIWGTFCRTHNNVTNHLPPLTLTSLFWPIHELSTLHLFTPSS